MLVILLLAIVLLSPLVFVLPAPRKAWYTFALMATGAAAAIYTAVDVLVSGSSPAPATGWLAEYFVLDNLSALFILIISLAAVPVGLYSVGYLSGYIRSKRPQLLSLHCMCLVLLFASMIAVVTSKGGYGFLFSWELMTIASFVTILFDPQKREVRRAALSYLVQMHIGFALLVAGLVIAGGGAAPADFSSLTGYFSSGRVYPVFLLLLGGFGMKAGVFPFHGWLPEAHPAAPSHVSAFMSGVMIKMGVYGVVRVLFHLDHNLFAIGMILFITGVVTAIWGVLMAAMQNEIKKLLAYSSIENIGIIFMALGLGVMARSVGNDFFALCAFSGALLHTVNHSLFKTLLFFGAGNVYTGAHTTSLDALGGLSKRMPVTAALFLVGVLAICALPPFNGFVSEFMIYLGMYHALETGHGAILAAITGIGVLALTGGVVLLAFTKLFGVSFLGESRSEAAAHAVEADRKRLAACAIPVAGILAVGFAPRPFVRGMFGLAGEMSKCRVAPSGYEVLDSGMYSITATVGILLLLVAVLLFCRHHFLSKHVKGHSPVWGCGFEANTSRMQYSGESFSEGLYGISSTLTHDKAEGEAVDRHEIFPHRHSFRVRHKDNFSVLFEQWWMELVRRINRRVMKLNTGKVNHYIIYALLFLMLVLVLSVTEIL